MSPKVMNCDIFLDILRPKPRNYGCSSRAKKTMTASHSITEESLWSRPSGVREVLSIALPMVASTLSWTLMNFTDGAILYRGVSDAAMSASFSAGVTWFLALSFFWGTCSYTSTFVSQYFGDKQPERIGPAVWQGVWLAMLFSPLAMAAIPLAPHLFSMHPPEIADLETRYFQVLCWGAPGLLAAQALEGFFSGRGRTRVVMCVDAGAVTINIALDCLLVLGWFGIPSYGLEGAAWATVFSQWCRFAIYLALILQPHHRKLHNTVRAALDWSLFRRLLRFGGPNGVQMLLDIGGFTFFVIMVGRLDPVDSTATSLVFRLSHLAFMPAWGFGIATTVLVGQRLGEDRPDLAVRAARTTLSLALGYMGFISLLFVAAPNMFLAVFASDSGSNEPAVLALAVQLLRFVAAYNMFDATLIIMSSVLRGAGDMQFIMRLSLVSAISLIAATLFGIEYADFDIYGCWWLITVWIWLLAVVYVVRYRQGKWQSMRVIEQTHRGAHPAGEDTAATELAPAMAAE
jgi:MATE family multidrug resistance protein